MIKLTDPSKLHNLGWKHTVELEGGIRFMYQWFVISKANGKTKI
jgi:GDP-L-fucose synthase